VHRALTCHSGTFVISNGVRISRKYQLTVVAVQTRAHGSARDGGQQTVTLKLRRSALRWASLTPLAR
jgi:hypothetical protein